MFGHVVRFLVVGSMALALLGCPTGKQYSIGGLETFFDLAEIEAAVRAVRRVCDLPIVAQMTINDEGSSLEGVSPEVFGPRLAALGVDALGVNCS